MANLTGNEVTQVLGNDNTGNPAATTFPARTSHIAGSGTRVTTSTTNFVSTTTLAPVAGLSVSLVAGCTYSVEAAMPISSTLGGVAVSLDTSDTLSLTSLNLTGIFSSAAAQAVVNTTSFQAGVGTTATVLLVELAGALVVNTAGTLILKAAQNASNAATTAILPNGFLRVNKVA